MKTSGSKLLLPRGFRPLGFIFIIFGVILGIARFRYGIKPDALNLKMFAFYSSYLESKYLDIIRNNMCEEVVALLLVMGLFFIAFSKEKNETIRISLIRMKALIAAVYLQTAFLLAAILFTFGFAFVYMLIVNMGVFLLFYLIVFRILLSKKRKTKTGTSN